MISRFLAIKATQALFISLLAVTLWGCGLEKPYPAINTFSFDPPDQPAPAYNNVRPYVIRVNQLTSAAAYETKKLIYKTSGGQMVEDFYNELFASPGRLLADNLATYLNHVNPYAQVVRSQGQKGADFVLEGYLAEFLGDFTQTPPIAKITLATTLNDVRRESARIILARTYQAQVVFQASGDRPAAELTRALALAWQQILMSLSQDMDQYFSERKKP
ncbi:MAG: hypothetical protein LBT86_08895 [Deltaproteobacteria bacterium]|jgi:ABC-type uncharacterized transport system auxiliary subunit|nr:hypothetical protein [Deltaproteobacteria bacterium]